jgi:replicative DNA helicase
VEKNTTGVKKMLENEDSEKNILGCMLLNNGVILDVQRVIIPDDFYNGVNKNIYLKILYLYSKKVKADISTVWNEMHGETTAGYIAELTDVASSVNWKHYADKIRTSSIKRKYKNLSVQLKEACESIADDSFNYISKLISEISGTWDKSIRTGSRNITEVVLNVNEKIENSIKNRGKMSGIDTGFNNLNRITDGFHAEYIVLAARTGQGKTALALNMANNMIVKGLKVAYFSLEMTAETCVERMLSSSCRIQKSRMDYGLLGNNEATQITEKLSEIIDSKIIFDDSMKQNIFDISAKCRAYVRIDKCDAIFIDHLSLIRHPNNKMPRHEQYIEISQEILTLVNELRVPIIVVCQLGRAAEGVIPKVSDIRESGSIEQDAHMILLIDRPRYKEEGCESIPTQLYVEKNRNGPDGIVELDFYPATVLFKESNRNITERKAKTEKKEYAK